MFIFAKNSKPNFLICFKFDFLIKTVFSLWKVRSELQKLNGIDFRYVKC